jgi:hypothetical protein
MIARVLEEALEARGAWMREPVVEPEVVVRIARD